MVPIENEKRVKPNWHKIRAEYIAGTSQRKLAEKYGVPFSTIERHCRLEKWTESRNAARVKIQEKVVQKTADLAADNATLAAGIKRKGLMLLDKLFDEFAKQKSTEHRDYDGNNVTDIKRLRDLTSAFKDLTDDIAGTSGTQNDLLQSLLDLEKRAGS